MGLQPFTSRKAHQGKGKPLQSLSTMVSLLESALREKEGSLQHKGTSRPACHGIEQAFIDGEGGSWDPYYYGIGPINKEGSMGGVKTTSLP